MRKALPLVLALCLAWPPTVKAGNLAVLAGKVLSSPDRSTSATAVWAGAVSAPVAADGTFRVEGLPGGPTRLAIETPEGLYTVSTPVTLAPGATRQVQLAFRGRQDTSPPPPAEPPAKKKSHGGVWSNPVYATLIVVGSAIVVGVAVDQLTGSSSNTASPSSP